MSVQSFWHFSEKMVVSKEKNSRWGKFQWPLLAFEGGSKYFDLFQVCEEIFHWRLELSMNRNTVVRLKSQCHWIWQLNNEKERGSFSFICRFVNQSVWKDVSPLITLMYSDDASLCSPSQLTVASKLYTACDKVCILYVCVLQEGEVCVSLKIIRPGAENWLDP